MEAKTATWVIVAYFSRYSSLASIASAVFAPLFYILGDRAGWYVDRGILLAVFMISIVLVVRHRENINKLLAGKESKLNFGKSSPK